MEDVKVAATHAPVDPDKYGAAVALLANVGRCPALAIVPPSIAPGLALDPTAIPAVSGPFRADMLPPGVY